MKLTRTKGAMEGFLADDAKLTKVRELLSALPEDDRTTVTLRIIERTFKCYIVGSQEAQSLRSAATAIERNLWRERGTNSSSARRSERGSRAEMAAQPLT